MQRARIYSAWAHGRLEHLPTWREGFPCGQNRDSPLGLVMEASPYGQTPLAGSSRSYYSGLGNQTNKICSC